MPIKSVEELIKTKELPQNQEEQGQAYWDNYVKTHPMPVAEQEAFTKLAQPIDNTHVYVAQGAAVCVVFIFLVYAIKKIIKMPKNWRVAYALAAVWVLGAPVFFWVFYREFGYSGEDVAKISLGFPPFGIFSYWLLMKAAK